MQPTPPTAARRLEIGDVLILAGGALIVVGVGCWSLAAAFVAAGVAIIGTGVAALRAP